MLLSLDDSNSESPKVPTDLRCLEDGQMLFGKHALDSEQAEQVLGIVIQWFKLLIVDERDLPEDVRASGQVKEARERLEELGMDIEEVIAAYLKLLWSSCLKKVERRDSANTVKRSRFHVVVTIPAICK